MTPRSVFASIWVVCSILGLGLDTGSFAEQAAQQFQGATIVGTVIDATSGEPVEGVRVTRIEVGGAGRQVETISDSRGRFAFTGVDTGRWRIVGELTGYESGANDRRRRNGPDRPVVLNPGAHETVVIRMFPSFGHLCGVAVDDRNHPVAGVAVNAASLLGASGNGRAYAMSSAASTDDGGRFCIRLLPGSYSIVIPPPTVITLSSNATAKTAAPGGTGQQRVQRPGVPHLRIDDFDVFLGNQMRPGLLPPTTSSAQLDSVFDHGLYPSAEGAMYSVTAGHTTTVGQVSLRRAAAQMITGTVSGPSGPIPYAEVRVIPRTFAGSLDGSLDIAATIAGADGAFTIFGVPSGEFVVRTSAPSAGRTLWADKELSVGGAGVRNVAVELLPGVRARGRVVSKSATTLTADLLARVSVALAPIDTENRGVPASRPAADGSFQTGDYPPGRYLLSVTSPTGWVLESAMAQRQNVALVPINLSADDSLDVVVSLTDQPAAVTGFVRSSAGAADPGATVILFPVQYHFRSSSGSPAPMFREARVAPDGAYEFRAVAPAEYFVLAIDDADAEGWRRADTVPRLAAAAERIRLGAGEQLTKELRTQAIGRAR